MKRMGIFLAGILLALTFDVAAQVYNFFPPPGLTYATAPPTTTLSVPNPASGNPGNNLSITTSPGVGTNQNGGNLNIISGAGTGTGQAGTITIDASHHGTTFSGSIVNPAVQVLIDPTTTWSWNPGGTAGQVQMNFTNSSTATTADTQFAIFNDGGDGFVACTTENFSFVGTDLCGFPRKASGYGCASDHDCIIVNGPAPTAVEVMNVDNVIDNVLNRLNFITTVRFAAIPKVGTSATGVGDLSLAETNSGTFTITYTGMTASVTGTAVWTLSGSVAKLFFPAAAGTSNATTFTATGLPAAIQPTRTQDVFLCDAEDSGASTAAVATFTAASGTVTLSKGFTTAGAWTNTGAKGIIGNGCTVGYLTN